MLPINDRRLGSDKDSERQFIFKFLKEKYIGEGLGQLPSLPVTAEFNFLLGNRGPPPYGEAAKHLSRSLTGVLLVMFIPAFFPYSKKVNDHEVQIRKRWFHFITVFSCEDD